MKKTITPLIELLFIIYFVGKFSKYDFESFDFERIKPAVQNI
jgi:hypothetical protein